MEFDKAIFDTVPHETKVIINDVEYQGFGVGKANEGLLSSQLNHSLSFDPEILAVHLIVGYPSYSEYKKGATDLFKPSTLLGMLFRETPGWVVPIDTRRRLQVPAELQVQQWRPVLVIPQHPIRQGDRSAWRLHHPQLPGAYVHGLVFRLGRKSSNHSGSDRQRHSADRFTQLVETFIPSGPGLIKSIMAVEWKCGSNNQPLTAVIESEYYLNHNESLPGLHWRHVTFETDKTIAGRYRQSEKITVHRDLFDSPPQNLLDPKPKAGVKIEGKDKFASEASQAKMNSAAMPTH